jgi:hypothetical protein
MYRYLENDDLVVAIPNPMQVLGIEDALLAGVGFRGFRVYTPDGMVEQIRIRDVCFLIRS